MALFLIISLSTYFALCFAKRQKGGLYSQDIINEILMHMTAEKVIESYTMYEEIAKVITSYRKNRRNKNMDIV